MSWQSYVDDQLLATKVVTKAAIIGLDGGVWASRNLNLAAGEGQKIANMMKDPPSAFATGIFVEGVKNMCIKSDGRSLYGKKGPAGVVCVKTNSGVVIGCYDETIQPGQCTNVVEKLADYLIENGC